MVFPKDLQEILDDTDHVVSDPPLPVDRSDGIIRLSAVYLFPVLGHSHEPKSFNDYQTQPLFSNSHALCLWP